MTIRQRVTIQEGGTIEIHDPELPVGAEAEVVVVVGPEELEGPACYPEFDPTAPSIWEKIAAISASVPMEEWEKLPRDLAKNFDHYHYGAPKEEDEE
jgi:hypothetical protein